MKNKSYATLILVLFLGIFGLANNSWAATIWCNPGNSGTENGTTKANGYKTLYNAMSHMSAGDTVIIANGDWSATSSMSINNSGHLPMSGTSYSNMTTFQAETDWQAKLPTINDQGTGGINYVKFKGIVFVGSGMIYAWHHVKFISCGFYSPTDTGENDAGFGVFGPYPGSQKGCSYVLMEDCIVWGAGRYTLVDYGGDHNIYRRVVVRHDKYCPDATGSCAPGTYPGQECNFRGYGTTNSAWQNCIAIDSDRSQYYRNQGDTNAAYWLGDQAGGGGNSVVGSFAIKTLKMAYFFAGTGSSSMTFNNSVAIGPAVDSYSSYWSGALVSKAANVTARNILLYNFTGSDQMGVDSESGTSAIQYSIAKNLHSGNNYSSNYNYYASAGSGWGANSTNADPSTHGLLYPVRIESGSALATACNGSQCGPTILKKIGVSGTAMDEAGWDTITNENLWPWPNEDVIKTLFSTTSAPVPGAYGFTAGTSIDGSPQTLTKYIWEYLGNKIPADIYGGTSAVLYGDVSADGTVSAYDASLAAQYAVSLITLTQTQITAADVSGDGTVSAYDASLISQKAVGLISKFPVEGG